MDLTVLIAYAVYFVLSLAATFWVGRSLFRHGRVFLLDVFRDPGFADAVNRLLLVGFYLVNVGAIALRLGDQRFVGRSVEGGVGDTVRWVEVVANKFGGTLLILGVLHAINLLVLARIRARARRAVGETSRAAEHERAMAGWTPRGGPAGS